MALSRVLVVLVLLYSLVTLVSSSGWKTLQGSPPLVIARGGFSGIFPASSLSSYTLALNTSGPNVTLWCDVQLTKDGVGICFPELKLENATDISIAYPGKAKDYSINGVLTRGWFSVDYNFDQLANVSLVQGVYSRTNKFDGNKFHILTVEDVAKLVKSPSTGLWLNVQHDTFFKQQNLSVENFLVSLSTKQVSVNYISSPDLDFLRRVRSSFSPRTSLIFRFLEQDKIEPTTNQNYGALLKNLTFIKTLASGILVPKGYIWPVDSDLYLLPHTSLVSDAHKEGLQVFVSDLVNDVPFSYNFSYDPLAECLSFIDSATFSVDGVLSDFPVTPSAAINCFSGLGQKAKNQVETLVITKYGASGDYPACTDLAYNQAKVDGADVLDCPVQMSKDGIPFCLSSIDLSESTTVAETKFKNLTTTIPEIKYRSGIYTFSLTWNKIKSLTPSILNPYEKYTLLRNPKFKSQGKLLTLSDFLSLAKGSGILISIENAAYLAEKQGLSVTNAVLDALHKAGYDKPGSQKVMIQSTHSSVLKIFKDKTKYERVYKVDGNIGDAVASAIEDIKTFADSVVVGKESVFPEVSAFLVNSTKTVARLKSFNLPVYVETFSNEFVSQAWDYYSDAFVEINSFVIGAKINGIITDFPKTADRYRKNLCLKHGNKAPYMSPIEPGKLLKQVTNKVYLPSPAPPLPVLNDSNVTEAPLPGVSGQVPIPSAAPGLRAAAPAPITA
ncbi:glycerophosphodiester phosphodiesterase GDPDL3-like [Gastrolobium bilobum]|uniref:glycerophosphodiester phosphodiesterase GDPDL3-like n=1 Tax=Gastrolobium bilobum TaxID=150636 RepID=UPI002AB1B5F3|nr:glycerophosphodiester phosphodiesterase GDPDL3-like [Gastrolobium bilobum]